MKEIPEKYGWLMIIVGAIGVVASVIGIIYA